MKKPSPRKTLHQGCGVASGILLLAFGFFVFWFLEKPSSQTVTIMDFTKTHEFSVSTPINPFRMTGALYVLYEGTSSTNTVLELTFNKGRDSAVIPLPSGTIEGVYGGAEYWVNDLSVRFVPCEMGQGTLKITAICGRKFTNAERKWLNKLYEMERMRQNEIRKHQNP